MSNFNINLLMKMYRYNSYCYYEFFYVFFKRTVFVPSKFKILLGVSTIDVQFRSIFRIIMINESIRIIMINKSALVNWFITIFITNNEVNNTAFNSLVGVVKFQKKKNFLWLVI